MTRWLGVFALLLVLLPNSLCQAGARQRMVALVERTVQVDVDCPGDENDGWGSGVIVGAYGFGVAVATADHVVGLKPPGCTFAVRGKPAQLLARDAQADVALVQVALPARRTLKPGEVYLGLPVIVVGYPVQPWDGKRSLQLSRGHVIAYARAPLWRMSAPSLPGGSGGPVFDEQGRLLGLFIAFSGANIFGTVMPVDGAYYFTPAGRVFALYEGLPRPTGQ